MGVYISGLQDLLFELLTVTVGPQASLLCSVWTFPLKMHYEGENWGEIVEWTT